MSYGEKITELRKSKGMTQAELGNALNVTFQAVSKWERGESLPDFATISKIAKLFDVSITYFEDNGGHEEGETTEKPSASEEPKEAIGFCTVCGKLLHEGEAATDAPIVCKNCVAQKERKRKERQEADARAAQLQATARKHEIKKRRNLGLIIGGIVAVIPVIIGIVSGIIGKNFAAVGGGLIGALFCFTFASQLVWDGAVRTVTLTGGKIVGMPGVIFDLDLDGIIFLIVVKILFAIIKFIIFIITLLFFVFIGIIISPFTFVPCLMRVSRGEESEW